MAINYPLYLLLGIAPSLIWLGFYLRKDCHPESNRMILQVFIFGMLATLPAALIELGLYDFIFGNLGMSLIALLIYLLFGIALTEEVVKYAVVRWRIFKKSAMDEPLDIMLYMIIGALGFAALENIFYIIQFSILEAFWISALRFVGAVFLHALASGTLGYFIALSFLKPEEKKKNLTLGFGAAILLHTAFNYAIIKIEDNIIFAFVVILLLTSMALFVSSAFRKLKKIKSVVLLNKDDLFLQQTKKGNGGAGRKPGRTAGGGNKRSDRRKSHN